MSDLKIHSLDELLKWLDIDYDPTLPDPKKEQPIYSRPVLLGHSALYNHMEKNTPSEVRFVDKEHFEAESIVYADKAGVRRSLNVWRKKR